MTTGSDDRGTAPAVARSTGHATTASAANPSAPAAATTTPRPPALRYQRIALVDLLDRLLAGGVVISGEIRLAIADVDLVTISLRALIASVSSALEHTPCGRTADDQ